MEKEKSVWGAWLAALLGWLIPGGGHLKNGRWMRGIVLGAAVWVLFLCGIFLGGHLYSLLDTKEGLLSNVFALCDLGTGLLFFGSKAAGVVVVERAEVATSEYGNVFLMAAGLLNYLLTLDAYDIGVGRKP